MSAWQEVPAERYLSWSPAMQYAYCARRDEDAALSPDISAKDAQWFRDRAARYREAVEGGSRENHPI